MTRKAYLAAVIKLYLNAPGSPRRASRADWAIAATLYQSQVPIERIAHAIRLASVRKTLSSDSTNATPLVRSLAYYRAVSQRLSSDETKTGYVDYVKHRYRSLLNPRGQERTNAETASSPPNDRAL